MRREGAVYDMLLALRHLGDAMDRMHGAVEDDMDMNINDVRALRMLVEFDRRGVSASPHDVARHLNISTASTSKLVDRLVEAGHVERRPHPSDRRARVLKLTDYSRHTFFEKFGGHLRLMSEVGAGYTDEELGVITDFMRHMAVKLDPLGSSAWEPTPSVFADDTPR